MDGSAALAVLNGSRADFAKASGIERSTIVNFENDARTPRKSNLIAIRTVQEAVGVLFIDGHHTVGPGVYLRDPKRK